MTISNWIMMEQRFSMKGRMKSFKFAFTGLRKMLKEEHNFRVHLFMASVVVVAGFAFGLTRVEWIFIVFAIGIVLSLEIINSSIECLADFISRDRNDVIKEIKDLSAAGVLMGSIMAFIIGLIIFLPKIL